MAIEPGGEWLGLAGIEAGTTLQDQSPNSELLNQDPRALAKTSDQGSISFVRQMEMLNQALSTEKEEPLSSQASCHDGPSNTLLGLVMTLRKQLSGVHLGSARDTTASPTQGSNSLVEELQGARDAALQEVGLLRSQLEQVTTQLQAATSELADLRGSKFSNQRRTMGEAEADQTITHLQSQLQAARAEVAELRRQLKDQSAQYQSTQHQSSVETRRPVDNTVDQLTHQIMKTADRCSPNNVLTMNELVTFLANTRFKNFVDFMTHDRSRNFKQCDLNKNGALSFEELRIAVAKYMCLQSMETRPGFESSARPVSAPVLPMVDDIIWGDTSGVSPQPRHSARYSPRLKPRQAVQF
eukprot:TRINITY_DN12100_c0_g1_i4.p1 TRINITY_DN12100_c0_g1~~TRINITY_DN12100_c0_g1_i4.p1  ORF type:complete len:355 (+),score=55.82 TRINITY_DN12100_c0_g1_i4:168-1232(+)